MGKLVRVKSFTESMHDRLCEILKRTENDVLWFDTNNEVYGGDVFLYEDRDGDVIILPVYREYENIDDFISYCQGEPPESFVDANKDDSPKFSLEEIEALSRICQRVTESPDKRVMKRILYRLVEEYFK